MPQNKKLSAELASALATVAACLGQAPPSIKKKRGFSKTAYICNWAFVLTVTMAALIYAWCDKDTSIFPVLLGGAWGEIAVHSAFLVHKSEKENTDGGIIYDMAMRGEKSKPRRTRTGGSL